MCRNPKPQRVNVTVENNLLHVTAEAAQKENGAGQSERYEQIISLPGPVESDKMQIDRKKNLVVITLPKAIGDNCSRIAERFAIFQFGEV